MLKFSSRWVQPDCQDFGLLNLARVRAAVSALTRSVSMRPDDVNRPIRLFSGGNQQKAIISRWLMAKSAILIFDEPTRGIDVGAKAEMHGMVRALDVAGAPTLVCSTDLEELTGLCDRVLVFYAGRMCTELSGDSLTSQTLLEAMNTGSPHPNGAAA